LSNLIELFLATLVSLLPIANPVSTAALFLGITSDDSQERKNEQALKSCIYMFFILVTFLLAGTLIMEFFGISIPGLRIAGGLMVAKLGMNMLNPNDEKISKKSEDEAKVKHDISFTPLAMPSLSGPGAIAVTIGLASETNSLLDFVPIILGITCLSFICFIALRTSTKIVPFFGVTGMNALNKIMGFLLLCVGVQFILNGVVAIITDPDFLSKISAGI
jgi:multiple antibiotic resistance protein